MTIGIDIVDINRIIKLLEKNRDKFYERIFTYREIEYIDSKNHNSQTIAGLYALKEALSKAFGKGIGQINWKDLEILHNDYGKPYLNLNKKLREELKRLNLENMEVTISHEKDYAIGFALGIRTKETKKFRDFFFDTEILNIISKRKVDSHKGSYGRVLIIGGSRGMSGSVTLSSKACMRTGTGLIYALVPRSLETIISIKLTEEIVKTATDHGQGHFTKESLEEILEAAEGMDAIAIGPGMGNNSDNLYLLEKLIENIEIPILVDADGINAIAMDEKILLNRKNRKNRKNTIVITPHPGELSRLIGVSIEDIQKNRIFYSKYTSEKYNVIVVLKGNNTVVCHKDNIYINKTGNPGMATAGSGDVLTGIITSFMAQGIDPFLASKLGVYIHGFAGDLVKYKKGEYGIIASDIVESIPYAIKLILDGNLGK